MRGKTIEIAELLATSTRAELICYREELHLLESTGDAVVRATDDSLVAVTKYGNPLSASSAIVAITFDGLGGGSASSELITLDVQADRHTIRVTAECPTGWQRWSRQKLDAIARKVDPTARVISSGGSNLPDRGVQVVERVYSRGERTEA